MNSLIIEATAYEPNIELNAIEDILMFEGESRPEDVKGFYAPVFTWLNDYKTYLSNHSKQEVSCVFNLDYFNSASSKSILDIIEKLAEIQEQTGTTMTIQWYYDSMDEDMKEAGEEFQLISELKFEFSEVS